MCGKCLTGLRSLDALSLGLSLSLSNRQPIQLIWTSALQNNNNYYENCNNKMRKPKKKNSVRERENESEKQE